MLQLAAASDQGFADGALMRMKDAGLRQTMMLPDLFRTRSRCVKSQLQSQSARERTD